MSTLRISNIEAKSVPASATIDEKVKITNSSGDPLVFIDGKTSGITTVGINTTDPNITFDANSNVVVTGIITATKFVGTIEPTNLTVGGDLTIPDKIIHTGDTNTAIRFPAADTITFETAGTERVRITSAGVIETKTRSAEVRRMILSGSPSNSAFNIEAHDGETGTSSGDVQGKLGLFYNDGSTLTNTACISFERGSGAPDGAMAFVTNQAERLRITSAGKIGIGHHIATQITKELTIRPVNDGGILIGRPGDTVAPINSALTITTTTTGSEAYHTKYHTYNCNSIFATYEGGGTGGNLIFKTGVGNGNESERLRITSDGKMGLGITSPTGKFAVSDGTRIAEINPHSSGTFIGNRSNHDVLFQVNAATKAKIDTNGHLTVTDGNLVIGTSGHGIDFSATGNSSGTMSSELLDDYEEGTFTPTNSIGMTLTNNNTAFYTKIGRMVHIQLDISFATAPNDTAQCGMIQSLPFTSDGTSGHDNTLGQQYISKSSNTGDSDYAKKFDYDDEATRLVIEDGESRIDIYNNVGNYRRSRAWLCGRRIRISAWYKTAS